MDYRSPLQDSYYSSDHRDSSYGRRYAPYTQRRDYQPLLHSADHPSSMTVARYSNRYKPTCYPKELNAQFGADECKLCGVALQSPVTAKMHYSGKQHMKKIKSYLIEWSSKTGLPMPEINDSLNVKGSALEDYCELCDVKLISINDKILHYSGKTHQKNERDPSNAKKKKKAYETVDISGRFGIGESFSAEKPAIENNEEVNITGQAFYCKLCDVNAVSQDQLNQHLSGKKHKEKFEKQNSDVVKKDKPYKCSICDVSLETYKLFQLHLQGKRHKKSISKMETYETGNGAAGPSSSNSLPGATVGGYYLKPSIFPKALTDLFCAEECKLCEVQLHLPRVAKAHYCAKQHMKKIKQFMLEWNMKTKLSLEILGPEAVYEIPLKDYCEVCKIKFDTSHDKVAHNNGTNHLAELNPSKLRAIKESPASETLTINKEMDQFNQPHSTTNQEEPLKRETEGCSTKVEPYPCTICNVSLETIALLQFHLLGEEHKKNILKMEIDEHEEDVKNNIKCAFCNFIGKINDHICENEIKNIEEKWVCTFCYGKVFETEQEYNEHKNSNRHLISILNSEDNGDVMVEELSHWYCLLCKKQSHSCKEYTDHFFEEKHMGLSQALPMIESNTYLFECTVCNITLTQELKEEHIRDENHIKESIKKDTIKTVADLANTDKSTMNFSCGNCNLGPLNFVQYSQHILGDNHIEAMMKLAQTKLPAISYHNY